MHRDTRSSEKRADFIVSMVDGHGLTAHEVTEQLFLLKTRGVYWREKSMGYTGDITDAGVYTFDDALGIVGDRGDGTIDRAEPLSIHLDSLRKAIEECDQRTRRAREMLRRLGAF